MNNKNYLLFIFVILLLHILGLSNAQTYVHQSIYTMGTKGCAGTPILVNSFRIGQCYKRSDTNSIKYVLVSSTAFYIMAYTDAVCTQNPVQNTNFPDNYCFAEAYKFQLKNTYVSPSPGYIYFERWPTNSACTQGVNNNRGVFKPGICAYSDGQSGFMIGTAGTATTATIATSNEKTCKTLSSSQAYSLTCANNARYIMNAFTAPALTISFGAVKLNSYNSITIPVSLTWPSPITVNVDYNENGGAWKDVPACATLSTGQSCTITGILPQSTVIVRALINGEQPFGGTSSAQSAAYKMPILDTMKTVTIAARTTKTVTVAYTSNSGVSGTTTFVVKSTAGTVGTCSFTQCVISGLNPGQSITATVNAVNHGTNSNTMTATATTYTALTTPSLSIKNTINSITATYSATGGVPSPATTFQVLLNNVAQSCSASPCTMSNLATLQTYSVQVRATNDGTTLSSAVQSVKLWNLMTTPTLTAVAYTRRVVLSFDATGGDPALTRFSITNNGAAVAGCQSLQTKTCTVSSLNPGISYAFVVTATNGATVLSKTLNQATYQDVATPSLTLTNTINSITATYSAVGGIPSPATTYQVLLGGVVQSCTASPCTMSGLTTLQTYTVQVSATNDGITSPSTSKSVKLWDLMTAPTLTAVAYTRRVVLSFDATGGDPALTRFSITNNGAAVAGCQSLQTKTCTVSSLNPGASYTFVVTATNGATVLSKTLNQVTYLDVSAPTISTTSITTKHIAITYDAVNGLPSGSLFTVNSAGVDVPGCINTATKSCTITGLNAGTAYTIKVTVTNDGLSVPTTQTLTTVTAVTTPAITISQTGLSLTIKYTTQYGYGASSYDVLVNNVAVCSATSALQCVFNNVVLGTKYDVQVKVTNDGASKTGTLSYQTIADTMKTLKVDSYTTKSVTFSYSSNSGVQGVTTFEFTINGSPVTCPSFTQCTVSGFTPISPGSTLTIVGKSINYENASPTMTITQKLYDVVAAPTLTVTNTPTTITATFSAIGGIPSPATTYQVLLNGVAQSCTTSPCTLSGLTTLQTYTVQVSATNDGTTTQSQVVSVKLWDLISNPTLTASMLTKSGVLSFGSVGGNPDLTRYNISINNTPFKDCQLIKETTCSLPSLNPGTTYTFVVIAINDGKSQQKGLTASTYSEISGGSITASSITTKLITVNFGVTGGVPGLTKYSITYNGVNAPDCIDISATSCTIKDLTSATTYAIQVTATNDQKTLPFSNSFLTYTKINTPTLTIIGKPTSIFARFFATGGVPTPSTTYQILLNGVVYPGCSGTAITCTISGLTTLDNYTVQAVATNDETVTQSAVQEITLWDLMGEPIVTATALTKTISLVYEAPGGDPLKTSFIVKMNDVVLTNCVESKPDASGTCLLTDLNGNTTYTFSVTASNGTASLTSTLDVTTYPLLSDLQVQLDHINTREIAISYSSKNGLPDNTTYDVLLNNQPVVGCTQTQATTCLFTGLDDGVDYSITVKATNDQLTLESQHFYTTYMEVSEPIITVSQTSIESFEIKYSTEHGIPQGTTYDVIVNETLVCSNTTELTCIYDQLVLGSNYNIKVIVYNDEVSKSNDVYHQTYSNPTPVVLNTFPTASTIQVSWNASENGLPQSTIYTTEITFNSVEWKTICLKSTELSCNIHGLAYATKYTIRVTVSNSFYDPVESTTDATTLLNNLDDSSCKKNETAPICSSHGVCDKGECQCSEGWTGIYCHIDNTNNNNKNETITPDPDKPVIIVDNNGVNYRFELLSVEEVDQLSTPIKTLDLSKVSWSLDFTRNESVTHPTTGETLTEKTFTYSSNKTTIDGIDSLSISFIQYQAPKDSSSLAAKKYPIAFAGKEYQINIGSLKFTMVINKWPFESKLNSLVLSTKITNPVGAVDECGKLKSPSSNDTEVSSSNGITTFNIGDGSGNYVVGNLLNILVVDSIPRLASHNYAKKDGFMVINSLIPYFERSAVVDPDIGLILSPKSDAKSGKCGNTQEENSNWKVIVGSVVGGAAGVALVAATILLIKKRTKAQRYNDRVAEKIRNAGNSRTNNL
ncbi:hypothetical protein PPL_00294 [Heterostelium album PN500]|uniref:Fibronectin type-III domain-containing protein n=1 Tax=Heterostelium pallidum (strain ATCC 26659 / Pp 5 / PN500) TaxID=670386 RepID=D3AW27_HETP5|nr:hypothetical protein PPL_00294 [Heterostelium album PN500]EFA86500.1 hypothetical protein PPL_00294 [Heterostelium album PN500]|eukprot:XP_020438605.1 hypothetical protein PPL_00294 [Heterostelium album PN500]